MTAATVVTMRVEVFIACLQAEYLTGEVMRIIPYSKDYALLTLPAFVWKGGFCNLVLLRPLA